VRWLPPGQNRQVLSDGPDQHEKPAVSAATSRTTVHCRRPACARLPRCNGNAGRKAAPEKHKVCASCHKPPSRSRTRRRRAAAVTSRLPLRLVRTPARAPSAIRSTVRRWSPKSLA
jgi:hypothetical protein